eukprot:TRINITY_DN14292_c0_g1_i1.p1 TRINITY_DN14292_c0_g1~~TRINITY_DN14292_c0_g1_i1.p1  ORF type:complete len:365 (+),score=86.03 TRINITY_DN14292_c0_g1_i1:143-1237(+)
MWQTAEDFDTWAQKLCTRVSANVSEFPRVVASDYELGAGQPTKRHRGMPLTGKPAQTAPFKGTAANRNADPAQQNAKPAKKRKTLQSGLDHLAEPKKRYPYITHSGAKMFMKPLKTTFFAPQNISSPPPRFLAVIKEDDNEDDQVVIEASTKAKARKEFVVTTDMRNTWLNTLSSDELIFRLPHSNEAEKKTLSHLLMVALPRGSNDFVLSIFSHIAKREGDSLELIPEHVLVCVVTDQSPKELTSYWKDNKLMMRLAANRRLLVRQPGDAKSKSAIPNKIVVEVGVLLKDLPSQGGVTILAPDESLLAGLTNTLSQRNTSCRILQYPSDGGTDTDNAAQRDGFLARLKSRLANKLSNRLYMTT